MRLATLVLTAILTLAIASQSFAGDYKTSSSAEYQKALTEFLRAADRVDHQIRYPDPGPLLYHGYWPGSFRPVNHFNYYRPPTYYRPPVMMSRPPVFYYFQCRPSVIFYR